MTDYEKLKQLIDEIPKLISANITSSDASFQAWKTKAERFLIRRYGANSYEYKKLAKTPFHLLSYCSDTPHSSFVNACQRGLRITQEVFRTYLDEMDEKEEMLPNLKKRSFDCTKLFIVHGHNGELKQTVARIVEKQSIEAVILSEQANQGRTIIEKIEEHSDVGGAICLFTADDIGRCKSETTEKARARQNVVFEAGFFIGKLGRERIIVLADEGIEIPSDLAGVVYTDTSNWQIHLLKELKAMGYSVDFNLAV